MEEIVSLIGSLGFPIAACVAIGIAMYKLIQSANANHKAEIESLRKESSEREQHLQSYLDKCQETNQRCVVQLEVIAERLEKLEKKGEMNND